MIRATLSLLVLVALVSPAEALAEGASLGRPDPLRPLIEEALRNNTSLAGERLAERRAASERDAARARFLPAVNVESRASHLDGVQDVGDLVNPAYRALNQLTGTQDFPTNISLTLPSRYESHVRITQPLVNEALRANLALAGARHVGQRCELGAASRRLAADVEIAYLQVASAQRLETIDAAALDLVHENERVAERLLAAGRVTPEAVLRARADRSEVEQQLADAREQVAAAARELNRLVGRPLDDAIEVLPDSVFETPFEVSVDAAVASALARREELGQGDAGVRAADAARRVARAALLPSLAGAFDVGWQGRDWSLRERNRSWTASLVVSWSLFHVDDVARREAAAYEAERARIARRDMAERIAEEVRNAHEAARVAHDAIATANARVDAAQRTFTLVQRRYAEGSASPVELVDARTSLTGAESNQALTLYRYAIRRVDLERAAALRDLPSPEGDNR